MARKEVVVLAERGNLKPFFVVLKIQMIGISMSGSYPILRRLFKVKVKLRITDIAFALHRKGL